MRLGIRTTIGKRDPAPATALETASGEAPPSNLDPIDQLSYLADMVAELTTMAKSAQQDRLAAILDLAQDEADRQLEILRTQGRASRHR
jgi:uncharacterized membrane protein